jgi:hypothetical protein
VRWPRVYRMALRFLKARGGVVDLCGPVECRGVDAEIVRVQGLRSFSASKPIGTNMAEQYVNGLSDSSGVELAATSERSRRSSPKPSADDRAKAERRKRAPRLSETDYLLNIWQSDCAELRQAGVELRLEEAEVDGKPAVILTLLEVSFCQACQTFHGTKGAHTRIR